LELETALTKISELESQNLKRESGFKESIAS
jgi:hypothetical protein